MINDHLIHAHSKISTIQLHGAFLSKWKRKGRVMCVMMEDSDCKEGKLERLSTEALLWNTDTPRGSEVA